MTKTIRRRSAVSVILAPFTHVMTQWRRQDLLRGGAKLEIMSWDTHGGLQRRVQ